VERTACVDIRALPLQLLLRTRPRWRSLPAVVVDRDTPQGTILWANAAARATRILPGMRYAAGLALSRDLQGGAVAETDTAQAIREVTERLWAFSPRVAPADREPGIFWVDAGGLAYLYPALEIWAEGIRSDLADAGFEAVVAVGFSRFGSYAVAKSASGVCVLAAPDEETVRVAKTPLARLGIDPALAETLHQLGIETVGALRALPAGSVAKRFGPEAEALYRFACGGEWSPLTPLPIDEPVKGGVSLDYPESNSESLLALVANVLTGLLETLAARHEALTALTLRLVLDDHGIREECLSPASPTLDMNQLLGLCRLRLGALALSAGVVEMTIEVQGTGRTEEQATLFPEASAQGLAAAARALARLRAEFGNDAVVRAVLQEAHLPEARFRWERCTALASPRPTAPLNLPLARRIFTPPLPLPPRESHEPDGWLVAGIADGPVEEVVGPHVVSGGWWAREVRRTYYHVRTRSGRWLWIYHDQRRRSWHLQGEAE